MPMPDPSTAVHVGSEGGGRGGAIDTVLAVFAVLIKLRCGGVTVSIKLRC